VVVKENVRQNVKLAVKEDLNVVERRSILKKETPREKKADANII
tara:strand:+ start:458 stop:589 length:132 start_codon:yes stop_codon:yes gene_type:complete